MPPTPSLTSDSPYLITLQREAEYAGCTIVVGAVIVNELGLGFVQKRAPDRRLFPDCWDIAGGHMDPGETIYSALDREISEETGWHLRHILDLIEVFDWETEHQGQRTKRREFDFLVTVDGDFARPALEWSKVSEFRWVSLHEVDILKENRATGDDATYRVVKEAIERYLRLTPMRDR